MSDDRCAEDIARHAQLSLSTLMRVLRRRSFTHWHYWTPQQTPKLTYLLTYRIHIHMFGVNWQRRRLISTSSFRRQCVGYILDTFSQFDMKVTYTHTPGDIPWSNFVYQITSHAKTSPNPRFVNWRRRRLTSTSPPVHRSYSWYPQPVDTKLAYLLTELHNKLPHYNSLTLPSAFLIKMCLRELH